MSGLVELSPNTIDDGKLIGRDPRHLTPGDFVAEGIQLRPIMKAVRAKCLDCCVGQAAEVRKCVATDCPLWPLRMGVFPRALRAAANAHDGAPSEENGAERPDFGEDER